MLAPNPFTGGNNDINTHPALRVPAPLLALPTPTSSFRVCPSGKAEFKGRLIPSKTEMNQEI